MDREQMQEMINDMRNIVKPYIAKQLKKINFEGFGNTDKAEFETEFEIVLTLAEQALAIPSAKPKTGYISIDDAMSVFDDFMCGEVDEDGTDTFLEMLKDRVERSE